MKRVVDYDELAGELNSFENKVALHPNWLFRGQTNSDWTLKPSFTRIAEKRRLSRNQALQLEREAVHKFSISGSKLLPLKYTIDLTLSRFKSQNGAGIDFGRLLVVRQ
ncbi:MAG: hypothetical protein JW787_12720 [Sedimentisphaerales bacterium]|nr:hypothetical protein [Sedimentisphaerales bacterium]